MRGLRSTLVALLVGVLAVMYMGLATSWNLMGGLTQYSTGPAPVLFGAQEGRIAKAHRGKDPLFLFAALQRHLQHQRARRA